MVFSHLCHIRHSGQRGLRAHLPVPIAVQVEVVLEGVIEGVTEAARLASSNKEGEDIHSNASFSKHGVAVRVAVWQCDGGVPQQEAAAVFSGQNSGFASKCFVRNHPIARVQRCRGERLWLRRLRPVARVASGVTILKKCRHVEVCDTEQQNITVQHTAHTEEEFGDLTKRVRSSSIPAEGQLA